MQIEFLTQVRNFYNSVKVQHKLFFSGSKSQYLFGRCIEDF